MAAILLMALPLTGLAQRVDTTKVYHIDSVEISGERRLRQNNVYHYDIRQLRGIVSPLGEADVLRYISTLPGVSQGMEGSLSAFVRGGSSGHNRYELDGVPVYGTTHLFGFLSVFHPDIVKDVSFRMGGFPASSGNTLASLTEINTPDWPQKSGSFSLSPFLIGGSLQSNTNTYQRSIVMAVRWAPLRAIYKGIRKAVNSPEDERNNYDDFKPDITDFFVKLNMGDSLNRYALSFYSSNDYLRLRFDVNAFALNWGNRIARFGWNHIQSATTAWNTIIYYNNFYSGQNMETWTMAKKDSELRLKSSLNEFSAKTEVNIRRELSSVKIGVEETYRHFRPLSQRHITNGDAVVQDNAAGANVLSAYGELRGQYEQMQFIGGLRENLYITRGSRPALLTDIHLTLTRRLAPMFGVSASYDRLSQFHHVLEGLPVGWSLDLLVPAGDGHRPSVANQLYGGAFMNLDKLSLSGGVYFKYLKHLQSYINPTYFFDKNTDWAEEIAEGTGRSYGLEFRAEKSGDRFTGAVSYTLSKTDRHFNEINGGRRFPFKFDRRHILYVSTGYLIRRTARNERRWDAAVSLSSGHRMTLREAWYQGTPPPFWESIPSGAASPHEAENAWTRQLMTDVNGYAMPAYFRTDLSYVIRKPRRRHERQFSFGFYNLLNRKNVYLIYREDAQWRQLSLLPIIPTFRWSIRF
ncbi:MAG: Plug domain-containing protein [Bacteroidales bacterium]|nr:Plug domain-containing protein [Bacteroidales bacterium]